METHAEERAFRLGRWRVEPALNRMSCEEEIVRVEPQNMKLLLLFVSKHGAVIPQSEIEKSVWSGIVVTSNSVYQSIAQLRRALGDDKARPTYIETVPRKGYRLVAPITFQVADAGTDSLATISPESGARQTDVIDPFDAEPTASEPLRIESLRVESTRIEPFHPDSIRADFLPAASKIGESTGPTASSLAPQTRRSSRHVLRAALLAAGAFALGLVLYFYADNRNRGQLPGMTAGSTSGDSKKDYAALLAASQSESIASTPSQRAYILGELADAETASGLLKQAREHLEQALAFQHAAKGDKNNPDIARILTRFANLDHWERKYDDAEANAREAVRLYEHAAPALFPDKVRAHDTLATILTDLQRYAEAAVHVERSMELSILLFGDSHVRTFDARLTLAELRLAERRLDEAEGWARRAVEGYVRIYGSDNLKHAYSRVTLATVLFKKARYADAAAETRISLDVLARISPKHPYIASARQVLGESLTGQGRYDEAERTLTATLQLLEENKAARWRIARATSALGDVMLNQGRLREAEDRLTSAARDLDGLTGWLESEARQATKERLQRLRQAKDALRITTVSRR